MPLGWHGMLAGFLAKFLAGLHQVLATWRAGLVVVSTVCPFRPTRVRLARNKGDIEARAITNICLENSWDLQRLLMKSHVPSLTTDERQHVRYNNLLRVGVCIQIAINKDLGCPAMGWDATPHHHTPTAKRTSLSNACILVALANLRYTIIRPSEWSRLNQDSSANSTPSHSLRRHLRWARDNHRRSARWRGSRSVRTQGRRGRMCCSCKRLRTVLGCIRRNPRMVRVVTLAV